MQNLLTATVGGVGLGVIVGMLAFAVVFLVRATGIVNFAAGALCTLGAFFVYRIVVTTGLSYALAVPLGIVATSCAAGVLYLLAIRPKDSAGSLNIVIRTLALYLLLTAAIQRVWGEGQPFSFKALLPSFTVHLAGVAVPTYTFGVIVVAAVLGGAFVWFFRRTRLGLQFVALSERADVARLLGVNVRALSAIAWAVVGGLSCLIGVLTAPSALLSSDMMDMYLLYAFTAAVIGGLTSLVGAFVGGIVVGCVLDIVTLYGGQDLGTFAVFGMLLIVLLVRPNGFFGSATEARY